MRGQILVSIGKLVCVVIEKDPFMVQFFEPNVRSDVYRQNDIKFELLTEEFFERWKNPS